MIKLKKKSEKTFNTTCHRKFVIMKIFEDIIVSARGLLKSLLTLTTDSNPNCSSKPNPNLFNSISLGLKRWSMVPYISIV